MYTFISFLQKLRDFERLSNLLKLFIRLVRGLKGISQRMSVSKAWRQRPSPLPTLDCSLRPPKDSKRFRGGLEKELRSEAGRVGTREDFTCPHHLTEVLNEDSDWYSELGRAFHLERTRGWKSVEHARCAKQW